MIELDVCRRDRGGPSTEKDVTFLPNMGLLVRQGEKIRAIDLAYFPNSTKVSAPCSSSGNTLWWVSRDVRKLHMGVKSEKVPATSWSILEISALGVIACGHSAASVCHFRGRIFVFQRFPPNHQELSSKYWPHRGECKIQPQHPGRILASVRHRVRQKAAYLFLNFKATNRESFRQ